MNSKFFHIALVECRDFKGTRLNITGASDSPNSDGTHIVSIGQGNFQITIASIKCGPGHGIR